MSKWDIKFCCSSFSSNFILKYVGVVAIVPKFIKIVLNVFLIILKQALRRIVRSFYCVNAYKLPTILINIILIKIIGIDI